MTVLGKVQKRDKGKPTKLARREAMWGLLFISPWIIGFLAFYLTPMVASLGFSLFKFNPVTPDQADFIGLANWKRVLFEDPEVSLSFLRIFKYGALALPIGLVSTLSLAILLNSRRLYGPSLFRTLFFVPAMFPLVASTLIWSSVFNEHTGWINLFLEHVLGIKALGVHGIRWTQNPNLVYFAYTAMGLWGIGYATVVFLAGLGSIPRELYDAATVDGAGWWRRLYHITLPMISPVIFYQLALGVIGLLQYFLTPFVLNRGDGSPQGTTRFIMVYFYKQAFAYFNMGYGATLAWAIFIVALILTVVLFGSARYWVYYAGGEKS